MDSENKINPETNEKGIQENDIDEDNNFEKLSSDYIKYDYNYKIIIIGNSGVGKTCLMHRAIYGEFKNTNPTVGFDFSPFVCRYKEKVLKLEIWDTCGQEMYRSLIQAFFTNASLAIIVYGVDELNSFESVNEWIMQCKQKCSPETKLILIGNKSDVEKEK